MIWSCYMIVRDKDDTVIRTVNKRTFFTTESLNCGLRFGLLADAQDTAEKLSKLTGDTFCVHALHLSLVTTHPAGTKKKIMTKDQNVPLGAQIELK